MTNIPTQADRGAAADYLIRIGRVSERYRPAILAGEWDHTEDVRAFTTHRLATLDAAIEVVRNTKSLIFSEHRSAGSFGRAREDQVDMAIAALEALKGGG